MSFDPAKELLPGLPAYKGGRMSDHAYDAGVGRYGRYMDGGVFTYAYAEKMPVWVSAQLPVMECCGYAASAPYNTEAFGPVSFSNGETAYEVEVKDKTCSVRQTKISYPDDMEAPCLLRAVTATDAEQFHAYLDTLYALGFVAVWRNTLERNEFLALSDGKRRIHVSFFPGEGAARFVEDNISAPIEAFGGGRALPDETVELCQFGLYYNHMIWGRCCDCGMFYIIKLPDNSLFLIDGGQREQATEAACAEILRVMRRLSKTAPDEKITIAGWFCTHAHDDHIEMFFKLLRKYSDILDVRRIVFNFPANSSWKLMTQVYTLKERLHRYCPNALYLKCHTGQAFTLAGVRFDILQTHEDHVTLTGNEAAHPQLGDFNDTSTVMKISYQGASFLVLGDSNKTAADKLLSHYSGAFLHCSVMQAAHHLMNDLPALYAAIRPEIALIPASARCAIDTDREYTTLCQSVQPQNCYFASSTTDILRAQDGRFKLIARLPVEGYIYDGSEI